MYLQVRELLTRTALYRKRFGWVRGCKLWLQRRQEYKKPRGELIHLDVPGLQHPVYIRAGYGDVGTFEQILLCDEADIQLPAQPTFILDAGANIGLTAIRFASRHPEALIVALEVDEENFRVLEHNAREYKNVRCIKKALWSRSAYVRITNKSAEPNAYQVVEALPCEPGAIAATTVDEILSAYGVNRADLIKIDIEGAEIEVMSTSQSWLSRVRIVAIETHDRFRPGCTEALSNASRVFPHKQRQEGEYTVLDFD